MFAPGNAVNYLDPARPGIIEVGAAAEPVAGAPAGIPVYYVKDNGRGIPAEFHEKIFLAFQRLHPDAARGEGVGLALVRRVVERHNGRIWLDSTPGAGTTFYLALPAPPTVPHAKPHEAITQNSPLDLVDQVAAFCKAQRQRSHRRQGDDLLIVGRRQIGG